MAKGVLSPSPSPKAHSELINSCHSQLLPFLSPYPHSQSRINLKKEKIQREKRRDNTYPSPSCLPTTHHNLVLEAHWIQLLVVYKGSWWRLDWGSICCLPKRQITLAGQDDVGTASPAQHFPLPHQPPSSLTEVLSEAPSCSPPSDIFTQLLVFEASDWPP